MKYRLIIIWNIVLRIVVFLAVFVAAVLVLSRIINNTALNTISEMSSSTFPLVYMQRDDIDFNCLHGYCRQMDVTAMRYSITPLTDNRQITLHIRTFGAYIDSVSYEVITTDGTVTLENTKVIRMENDGEYITSELTLAAEMLMDQEYVLKINVSTGGSSIYYYTNVLLSDGIHFMDYLNYANNFWDKCINKTNLTSIGEALEPDETTDAEDTLSYMDIHDSVSRLTWGELNPQIYYKPVPRLTEINKYTATLVLDYRIASTGTSSETEIYNVHEYYRLRYTDSRIFLLNFERTTGQIFDPGSGDVLDESGIILGIAQKDVTYMTDEKAKVIAFVQEDELWLYTNSSGSFVRIFGFPQQEDMDGRDFYKENTILILKVTSDGDVTFAVGGYMNRGSHEGDNGIGIFRFDSASSQVSDLAFLQSNENTERIQMDMEGCLYLTQDERTVWCVLDGVLYRVDLTTEEVEEVVRGINNECYEGSESGQYFAWLNEGKIYGSSVLEEIDFESGDIHEITAGENEYLRPLAYMGEDLVYGVARISDIQVSHGGNGIFPMYCLKFEDGDGNIIKTYEQNGLYVVSVSKSSNLLNLNRVAWNGEEWVESTSDQIVSANTAEDVSVGIATKEDSIKLTLVILRIGESISVSSPAVGESKIISGDGDKLIQMPQNPDPEELYYVYALGGLEALCTYPNEAIVKADEMFGAVIDHNQDYLWVRGDKENEKEISIEDIPVAIRTGILDIEEFENAFGMRLIDLSGCTLDEVLYFVSNDKPVIAETDEGFKMIVGYDEYNTYLLNPGEDEWYYYGINDSTELFSKAGNIFYTYSD